MNEFSVYIHELKVAENKVELTTILGKNLKKLQKNIKNMEDISKMEQDQIRYKFRIKNISTNLKFLIENKYSELPMKFSNRAYEGQDFYLITIDLQTNHFVKIKALIDEFNITEKEYDFFVSLTSYKDITGISFPYNISKFHQEIGGNIEISIISLA